MAAFQIDKPQLEHVDGLGLEAHNLIAVVGMGKMSACTTARSLATNTWARLSLAGRNFHTFPVLELSGTWEKCL
jgi:hypothetical protein